MSCHVRPAPPMWRWTALGAVYVTDASNGRVVKLAPGSATPTLMPFADLSTAAVVAVDSAGNVYRSSAPTTTGC